MWYFEITVKDTGIVAVKAGPFVTYDEALQEKYMQMRNRSHKHYSSRIFEKRWLT